MTLKSLILAFGSVLLLAVVIQSCRSIYQIPKHVAHNRQHYSVTVPLPDSLTSRLHVINNEFGHPVGYLSLNRDSVSVDFFTDEFRFQVNQSPDITSWVVVGVLLIAFIFIVIFVFRK